MKSKDKSSNQRFGHVNTANPDSYFNIIFIELELKHAKIQNKTRPGIGALYYIQPGNGAGLFLQPRSEACTRRSTWWTVGSVGGQQGECW